ncbi:MAG: hypothetical protein MRZ79_27635 [Bacteroidia bacterium]|nr:hypothetical protein [Bacteroidia bacterium]
MGKNKGKKKKCCEKWKKKGKACKSCPISHSLRVGSTSSGKKKMLLEEMYF